jgi:diaminopimelate epimerase
MRMTKHHGLGNDFLVLLDLAGETPIDEDVARAICDRHRGVGADGLIRVTRGERDRFRMELRNEDGSRAEMSGNGISCMAQAIVLGGDAPDGDVRVDTDAGPRDVRVVDSSAPHRHRMRVAMGTPTITGDLPEWQDHQILRAVQVDVGNPHVVCHVAHAEDAPDLVALGERVNASTPGGTNVELITVGGGGSIVMSVYERGVGPTQACGTGAVAAAAAAHAWELAPSTVRVTQPGGDAEVELGSPAHLTVPVEAVAAIEWPLGRES